MKEIVDIPYEDYKRWAYSQVSATEMFDQAAALLTGAGFTVPMVGKLETGTGRNVFFGGTLGEKETERYGVIHMALVLQPSQSVSQAFSRQESEMIFALGAKRGHGVLRGHEPSWNINLKFENNEHRLSWWVMGDIPAPPILAALQLSNAQTHRRLVPGHSSHEAAGAMRICASFFKEVPEISVPAAS